MITVNLHTQSSAFLEGDPFPEKKALDRGLPQLLELAAEESATFGVLFVDRDGTDTFLTYPALLCEARVCLSGLLRNGVKAGDQLVFQIESPQDIIIALWACIIGGVIPVIMPVIRSVEGNDITSRHLLECWRILSRPQILASRRIASMLQFHLDQEKQPVLQPIILEEMRLLLMPQTFYSCSHGSDTALLLWTSGSTGKPKLVIISHRNIIASIIGSSAQLNLKTEDISLNWLPLYHVGGLMRSIRDVYLRCQSIQVSIDYILEDPSRWLDLIHKYRVTTTWGSNFSFDLIADKLSKDKSNRGWNLEALRSMCSSGEPVSIVTMTKFYETLAQFGLQSGSFHQSWGLTEACSATHSLDYFVALQRGDRTLPDVGTPVSGMSVRVVDDEDHVVNQDTKGHVQICGPSCVSEYFIGSSEETKSLLTHDGWLRTGDIGYILDDRLFITGRNGQWIVRNGRKFAVDEIENFLQTIDGLTSTKVLITPVRKSGRQEELAVFFELESGGTVFREEIAARIQGALTRMTGFSTDYIVPIHKKLLSGSLALKKPRTELRAQFEQGCFDHIFLESKWQKMSIAALTNNSTEDLIASLFGEALGLEGLALDDDFFRHGGTSIQAIHLMSLLQSKFGPEAPRIDDLFRCPTVRSLAELILRAGETSDPNMHSLNQIATRSSALEGQQNRRSARINSRLTN